MDNELLVSLTGVIATLVVGFLGIRLSRGREKKVSLKFVCILELHLFESIVQQLEDIDIKYRGQPINDNVVLLKGSIVNDGIRDIDKAMIYKPLSIGLPKDFKWLDVKIIKKSKDLKTACCIQNDRSLRLDWDLLKRDEFITFLALVEYTGDKEYDGVLNFKFNCRMTNLFRVKQEAPFTHERLPFGIGLAFVFACIGLIFIGIGMFGSGIDPNPYEFHYRLIEDGKKTDVMIEVLDKDTVILVKEGSHEREKIELKSLFREKDLEAYIYDYGFTRFSKNFNIIFSIIIILLFLYILIGLVRRIKLEKRWWTKLFEKE
jgi:hypothetical protein